MLKTGRWKSDKNKIKALFILHFHATGVAEVVGDSLVITLIPADVGKPTVRLDKAVIRDGCCYWEKPIHESLRLFREPRSGKFQEKIYYFVVSNGWSKAGFVGEVSIDFASYAESFKVSCVSLPFKNAKCDAILHVSIQRVQEDIDQKEIEEIESASSPSNSRSLGAQLNNSDVVEIIKDEYMCAPSSPLYDEIPVTPERKRNNRESCGSDLTISSSESSYGLETPTKSLLLKDNIVHNDHTSVLLTLDLLPESTAESGAATSAAPTDVAPSDGMVPKQGTTQSEVATSAPLDDVPSVDWMVSEPLAVANDFPKTIHEEKFEENSSLVIDELKAEISTLSRKAEVAELELKTLRKVIVKENRKGLDLLREVVSLKDERNALKIECEKFKEKNKFDKGDPRALIRELRQEVYYEKENNANLRVQLMKMQESNSELILAINELDEMLEQKDNEILALLNSEKGDNEEQKTADLYNEIEINRRDKEELEAHIEQLVLDYEILKQENHELSYQLEQSQVQEQLKLQYECSSYATNGELQTLVKNLENELKKQSIKISESLETIAELEENAKGLSEDLEKQAQGFKDDINMLICDKIELEKRAILAEETLRKTRWQNGNTAERIHDEFRRLSVEMSSTLESNEIFTKNALFETNKLRLEKSFIEDLLMKSKEELDLLKIQYEAKLNELSSQLSSKINYIEHLEKENAEGEENNMTLSEEILMLRAEIETLMTENSNLSAEAEEKERLKAEFEKVNLSMREMEMVLEKGKVEINEREREIIHLQEEAQQSVDELNNLRKRKDEKKIMIENLRLEFETLQNQHDELKHLLSEDQLEKDNLKNKIELLEGEIKMKETALEDSMNSYLEKEEKLQNEIEELEKRLEDALISSSGVQKVDEDNDAICLDSNICTVANFTVNISTEKGDSEYSSKNYIQSCGISAGDEEDISESSKEMKLLKDRNKEMEYELKEMRERYSEMSLKLAEVEGGRQQLMMRVRNLKNAKKS